MPSPVKEWARRRSKATREQAAQAARAPKIVEQIRREAKAAGATLAHGGQGGLDPKLALRVFRKDKWRCQIPNCETPKEKIDLDHIGGHPHELLNDPEADAWLKAEAEKGKQNTTDGIHVLCLRHHDLVHTREREIEDGKQPQPMTA